MKEIINDQSSTVQFKVVFTHTPSPVYGFYRLDPDISQSSLLGNQ